MPKALEFKKHLMYKSPENRNKRSVGIAKVLDLDTNSASFNERSSTKAVCKRSCCTKGSQHRVKLLR